MRTIVDTPMLRSLFLLVGAGVLRVRPVERAAAADGDQGAGRDGVRVRHPGGADVGRVRRRAACSWPATRDRLQTGLWLFVGCLGMGIAWIFYGLSPMIEVAILWVMVSGLLQLAVGGRPADAAPAQHPARAAGPRVLRPVRDARRHLPRRHGLRRPGRRLSTSAVLLIALVADPRWWSRSRPWSAPGVGRPAAEWRRALAALRAVPSGAPAANGEARPATMADFELLTGRLATFGQPVRHPAGGVHPGRPRPRGARGGQGISTGESASAAYFILEGETAAGIPEPDGGYRGPVHDGRGRLLRGDRGADRQPAHRRRGGDPGEHAAGGAGGCPARGDGGPRGQQADPLDAHRTAAADQPAGPAAPRDHGPGGRCATCGRRRRPWSRRSGRPGEGRPREPVSSGARSQDRGTGLRTGARAASGRRR